MISSNPVLRVATKILFAPIILFGLYVQFHGDFGPGGGFQAGVIIAAAFILYGLVFGLKAAKRLAPPKVVFVMMLVGVSIYTGVGVFTWLRGGNYLDYNFIDLYDPANGQHLGILLVELGVGVTVTSVMLALFFAFAGYAPERGDKSDA
jgi:multicomponent Na+:H+ antiporter subunit B